MDTVQNNSAKSVQRRNLWKLFSLPNKSVWEFALQSGILKVHVSHLIKIPLECTSYSCVLLYLCSLRTDSAFITGLLTYHH